MESKGKAPRLELGDTVCEKGLVKSVGKVTAVGEHNALVKWCSGHSDWISLTALRQIDEIELPDEFQDAKPPVEVE